MATTQSVGAIKSAGLSLNLSLIVPTLRVGMQPVTLCVRQVGGTSDASKEKGSPWAALFFHQTVKSQVAGALLWLAISVEVRRLSATCTKVR